ncbi:hypothetical protein J27TS7_57610 [Paenibacillus dendritiformis]|uniref:phage antirepressor KilAC domain-containing protein n=1 Tax=Paenibacillus dendritiformis TaxID=130049 RepID=UPI001B13D257|nr:phage antirepressor KilAC domain-containing protein [Paenibacillus dendritiformis]GIO76247.1 hypothetical protein J27TS7_57610 [Paenibacillus dendritiformis]
MTKLQAIEHKDQRVLLTTQLAASYGAESDRISKNFHENKNRFKEGKHFYKLEGESLLHFRNSEPQLEISKMARVLYLWTEKGAWMHAKSLNTDQAWDAYEMLVDDYYRVKAVGVTPSYAIEDPIARAQRWIEEQKEKQALEIKSLMLEQRVAEYEPKISYLDRILQSKGTVTITQIAKDYGMSGQALNQILHEEKVQYKQNKQWLLYRQHHDKGYTKSETIDITRSNGEPDVTMNTRWTQKGRLFIHEILQRRGIVAVMDRERVKKGESA